MSIEAAFMGSVVRDAETKVSKNGKPYARFTVRVGDGDGASWISVMYFADDAADLAPRLVQGIKVYCEGSLRLDRWDKAGVPQSGLSVMSFHCRVAAIGRNKPARPAKPGGSTGASQPARGKPNNFHDDEIPF
jgi:single-stranded DNA-binding protein